MPRYTSLGSPRCTSLKSKKKNQKNLPPKPKSIWLPLKKEHLILIYFPELWDGKRKTPPSQKLPLPPWKTPWDIGSKYTICTATLYMKTHTPPIFLWEKNLHFLPLTERKKASIFGNLLFNKWRESGCDFNSFHPDLQFLNKFPAPSSKPTVSVTPLAKSKEE